MKIQNQKSEFTVQIRAKPIIKKDGLKNFETNGYLSFSQRYTLSALSTLYYIGFVPFRFHTNDRSITKLDIFSWKVRKSVFQKLLCVIVHMVLFAMICCKVYGTFGKDSSFGSSQDSPSMLQAAMTFNLILVPTYFIVSIWRYENRFKTLIQLNCQPTTNFLKLERNPVKRAFENVLAILFPLLSFAEILVAAVHEIFKTNVNSELDNWKIVQLAFCVISQVIYELSVGTPDILFPLIVLSYRDRAEQFLSFVFSSKNAMVYASSVIKEFYALEKYVNEINDKFGIWILIYSVATIPFYSINLIKFFSGTMSLFYGLTAIWFCCGTSFYFLMAANVSSEVCDKCI